ncbi:MAG: hypothetical protein ACLQFR_21850 [Streptosporangiaceae bacterium]
MPVTDELTRSRDAAGNVAARLGLPLADEYLAAGIMQTTGHSSRRPGFRN